MPFIIVPIPLSNFCSTQPAPSSDRPAGDVQASLLPTERWWWKALLPSEFRGAAVACCAHRPPLPHQRLTSRSASLQQCAEGRESGAEARELHRPLLTVVVEVALDLRNLMWACLWVVWTREPGMGEK